MEEDYFIEGLIFSNKLYGDIFRVTKYGVLGTMTLWIVMNMEY